MGSNPLLCQFNGLSSSGFWRYPIQKNGFCRFWDSNPNRLTSLKSGWWAKCSDRRQFQIRNQHHQKSVSIPSVKLALKCITKIFHGVLGWLRIGSEVAPRSLGIVTQNQSRLRPSHRKQAAQHILSCKITQKTYFLQTYGDTMWQANFSTCDN